MSLIAGVAPFFSLISAAEPGSIDAPVRPFLESYCIRCHGGEETKGEVDLTGPVTEKRLLEQHRMWREVIAQVDTEEMPPKGAMPSEAERDAFNGWLRQRLAEADWEKYREPGHVTVPRLTKSEYRNTMRDLLGVDLRAGEDLPDDAEGESGFTNDRDALSMTPVQMEQLFQSAERAIDGVFALAKPRQTIRFESETMDRSPPKLELHEQGVVIVHPDHELKVEADFPADGWQIFRIHAAVFGGKPCVADVRIDGEVVASVSVASEDWRRAPAVEAIGFVREGRHSVTIQSRNLVPQTPEPPDIVRLVDERARELAPRLPALTPNESAETRKAREDLNHKAWGVQECYEWLRALGPGGDPRKIDLRRTYLGERQGDWEQIRGKLAKVSGVPVEQIDRLWRESNAERLADNARLLDAVAGVKWEDWMKWQGKLYIDRLEIAGPVRPGPPSGEWTLLDALSAPDANPETLIRELLPRAFRRPVAPAEADRYVALLREAQGREELREDAVSIALTAILASPRLLYRDELPSNGAMGEEDWALDDFALASRLSYFLWQSMPDAELFDLADSGLLADPAMLVTQADRMLDDPKADAFFETFALDWLGIRALGKGIAPDPSRFPEFDQEIAAAMREETVRTLASVFREDRPLVDLLDSPNAWLNETLARHYGIGGVKGESFRLVDLPDQRRGGLLGMGSVLVATSAPARTNPVRRGTWVMERLLGEDPGEPLPNAGELPGEAGEARGLTLREELALHRNRADCARCHDRIDPIGFGLENYDATGRWRDLEAGRPVDASGRFPDGRAFSGPAELKGILVERRDEFERNVARRLLAFALGRELQFFDEPLIGEIAIGLRQSGGSARELVRQIVMSDAFRRQSP